MEQSELVRKIVEELEARGWLDMVVGSLASGVYGEPRLTQDIDVVVAFPLSDVDSFCEAFPAPDFYVSQAAEAKLASFAPCGQRSAKDPE